MSNQNSNQIPVAKIGELEVLGDINLYNKCQGFLVLSEYGNVIQVKMGKVSHPSWFEAIDKGGIPLYGFGVDGKVICGLCASPTDLEGKSFPDKKERIIIVEIDRTDDFGWEAASYYQKEKARKAAEEKAKAEREAARIAAEKKAKAAAATKKQKEKAKFDKAVADKVAAILDGKDVPPVIPVKRPRGRPRKNHLPVAAAPVPESAGVI